MSDKPEDMDESSAIDPHFEDEATPGDVPEQDIPSPEFGLHDRGWTEDQWLQLLQSLINSGIGSWKDVTALVLGHLNPSQVGTSLASSEGFKRKYGKGNTMRVVMEWVYQQTGQCADCGTRLELQADHMRGRESYADPLDADFIENMTLRCRRCNVVRRPSHEFGGLTFLTAEAALMWIMLVIRPRTLFDYIRLCRLYGMTMSDIRMQEAWAMAHWLARAEPPAYGIEDDEASIYDLLLWPDSAITRADTGQPLPEGSQRIHAGVTGASCLGFLTLRPDGRIRLHEQPVAFIPFSTYELGDRPAQSLCIRYAPPDRKNGQPQQIAPLAPRGLTLLSHAVRRPDQAFRLASAKASGTQELPANAPPYGRLITTKLPSAECRLEPVDSSVNPPLGESGA